MAVCSKFLQGFAHWDLLRIVYIKALSPLFWGQERNILLRALNTIRRSEKSRELFYVFQYDLKGHIIYGRLTKIGARIEP